MSRKIPTEQDWRSVPWDLDIPHAYAHFSGKSYEEAVALFKDNAILYQEDLVWMPDLCFPFYAHAYITYLLSEDAEGDSDAANCYLGLVNCRCKQIKADEALLSDSINCLDFVAANQPWFDADPSIYGDFAKRAAKEKKRLR